MLFQWAAVTFSIHTPFKVLFFVKNIGQWNAKSGPKAAYGNFAMRKKNSGSLKKKWKRKGRNGSHFAHTHTHSAKLVVRICVDWTVFLVTYQTSHRKHCCQYWLLSHYLLYSNCVWHQKMLINVPKICILLKTSIDTNQNVVDVRQGVWHISPSSD